MAKRNTRGVIVPMKTLRGESIVAMRHPRDGICPLYGIWPPQSRELQPQALSKIVIPVAKIPGKRTLLHGKAGYWFVNTILSFGKKSASKALSRIAPPDHQEIDVGAFLFYLKNKLKNNIFWIWFFYKNMF